MNRAICIAYHQYTPFGREFYMPLYDLFIENLKLWENEFDTLYIIDSEYHFTEEEKNKLRAVKSNTVFLNKELDGHHWVQFKWAIPQIKEDNMLFLDNDVVIYKKGIVDNWFNHIDEGYDFVGSFDGSGGNVDKIHTQFSWMKKKGYTRMGSYYFILTKKLLNQIPEFDFAPWYREGDDWYDSFGRFTVEILKTNPKIYEIEDDRSSIYITGEEVPENARNLGYYHTRNGSWVAYLLASYNDTPEHRQQYLEYLKVQPQREYIRQCAWYQYMGGNPSQIINDTVGQEAYNKYYIEFIKYHGL